MKFGIDRLVDEEFALLQDQRVGLFTNLSAVDGELRSSYLVFADHVQLTALFGPEHGLAGVAADGVTVPSSVDTRTDVPVHSLYGDSFAPTADMLADIDIMVCDIQDIGVRYYTFLWTVTYILEACGAHHVPVMILDRPNPLGDRIDGGTLAPHLASLVGRFPIPIQHGMTLGELALMFNDLWNPTPAALSVVRCEDWLRDQRWPEIKRPFVPPSPNMPHFTTALHYPGACLVEGTTLSEGRGTALPFEVVGAPYIDGLALATSLDKQLSGASARPVQFQPAASKYAGEVCGGIQVHITDLAQYRPLEAWLTILKTIHDMYPAAFQWLPRHGNLQHFDRLIGDETTRQQIESGQSIEDVIADWPAFHEAFRRQREPFLLYEDVS